MKVSFKCPACGQTYELDGFAEAAKVQCAGCGAKFILQPDGQTALVAPAPIAPPEPAPVPISDFKPGAAKSAAGPAPAPAPRGGKPLIWAAAAAVVVGLAAGGFFFLKHGSSRHAPVSAKAGGSEAAAHNAAWLEARLDAGDVAGIASKLDTDLLAAIARKGGVGNLPDVIADAAAREDLAQREFIRACGHEKVADLAKKEGGAAFLKAFLKSPGWVDSFLSSGPPAESFAQALQNLYLLHHYGKDLDHAVYRRLATALALQAGKILPYRLVTRFQDMQQAHRALLLHASFDTLDVRGMRWSAELGGNTHEYQFILDDRQTTFSGYFGSCWACWYLGDNAYGDTVQGPLYYKPWQHCWEYAECARNVGGVCGSLSTFGSRAARVHGIPSTPVGQPGHCAYVIRVGDEWPVAYNVTWPTGFSAPGWEGTGYATAHRLYEPVYQDLARFMAATRLTWLAHLLVEQNAPRVRVLPGLTYALYQKGVGAALPDFSKLTPDASGAAKAFDLDAIEHKSNDNFGVVWNGELEVAGSGTTKMVLDADDGGRVLVDGKPIAAVNCNRKAESVQLSPGRHPVRVEYCQGGGAFHLKLELAGQSSAGEWTNAFEQAIAAQPLNFGVWLEYFKTLEEAGAASSEMWRALAARAATTFAPYEEAGWALVQRALDKVLPAMTVTERLACLTDLHRELRQEKADRFEGYPMDGFLNWQADRIGDPVQAVRLFSQILPIHTAKAPNDWVFGQVLNWGQSRFAKDAKSAPVFAEALESYFRRQGETADANVMRNQIQAGLRAASERKDTTTFRVWSDMATQLLPALKPGDVFLDDKQAAAFPRFSPFTGELLSREGLLRTSSAQDSDRPLTYAQVLDRSKFGGWFDTHAEDAPWAIVDLPGDAVLSGVVLVNRYDAPAETDWAVPLKISVSADGKSWTPVATFNKAEPVFSVNLGGRDLRARSVKIERLPGKPSARFHFRNFLVYGKRLY